MQDIVVRPARERDIIETARIYGASVSTGTGSYELEAPTAEEMKRRFHAIVDGGFPYLVAEIGANVVGFAYAGAFRPRRAYRFTVENSVYVDPSVQGRGVGKALLRMLVADCAKLGFRQIVAVIGDGGHNIASVRLHESIGFGHAGILRASGYKQGRWLDTVFMQMTINGGDTSPPDPASLPEQKFRVGG